MASFFAVLVASCTGTESGVAGARSTDVQSRVQTKAREVQEKAPRWAEAGGDGRLIAPHAAEVDAAMKAGRYDDAEAALDAILAIVDEDAEASGAGTAVAATPQGRDDSPSAIQGRVMEKAQRFENTAPGWIQTGGSPSQIDPLAKQLDRNFKSGDLQAAERTLDELLALVESAPPTTPRAPSGSARTKSVRLGRIPASAEIIYHHDGYVFVMDGDAGHNTQITFEAGKHLEHVAASYDRKRVVANWFADPSRGGMSSRLVLWDLEAGTETELLPNFKMAGNGGVEWDPWGYIYFAGVEADPHSRPKNRAEFVANMAANDVWKVKWDGTGLQRLTRTTDRGEADVSVSEDGSMVSYMATKIQRPKDITEIWISRSDGSERRLLFTGGEMRVTSVHDPEFSPDNRKVIFSQVNPKHRNFPDNPAANTAHDIYVINADGSGFRRLTKPGPISVIPDWQGSRILFLEMSDKGSRPFFGISMMNGDGSGYGRLKSGANIAKWIPRVGAASR
jgi:hypothetical protein